MSMKITKENALLSRKTWWWQTKTTSYQEWAELESKFKKTRIQHSIKCELWVKTNTLWVEGDMSCLREVKVDGNLTVEGNLYVKGSLSVSGSVQVDGFVIVDGNITVGGDFTCSNQRKIGSPILELAVNCGGVMEIGAAFNCVDSAKALLGLSAERVFVRGNLNCSYLRTKIRAHVSGTLRSSKVDSPRMQIGVINVDHLINTKFVKCRQWVSGGIEVGTGSKWPTYVYKDGRVRIGCRTDTLAEWSKFFRDGKFISSNPKKYPQEYAIIKAAFMVAKAYYEHVVPNIESESFTIDQ